MLLSRRSQRQRCPSSSSLNTLGTWMCSVQYFKMVASNWLSSHECCLRLTLTFDVCCWSLGGCLIEELDVWHFHLRWACLLSNCFILKLFSSFHVAEGMSIKIGESTSTISAMVLVHWPVGFHIPVVAARSVLSIHIEQTNTKLIIDHCHPASSDAMNFQLGSNPSNTLLHCNWSDETIIQTWNWCYNLTNKL